jgi:hypothetical protein
MKFFRGIFDCNAAAVTVSEDSTRIAFVLEEEEEEASEREAFLFMY